MFVPLTQALYVMTEHAEPSTKILFRVPNEDGSAEVETLWAVDLGNDQYRLDNSPFYAYSVSWQDIVYAPFSPEEQFPAFQRVVAKSGNRTVRIIFNPPVEQGNSSESVLQGLVRLGCSYEGANKSYISINIPPNVDLNKVREYLIEHDAQWEHADPCYAELFPEDV